VRPAAVFTAAAASLLCGWAGAQPIQLRIYSEFQRVDPFGRIVEADRALRPREILSPAVARNGYASFHVVVIVPPQTPFVLHFGQNPEDVLKLTVYKERFVKVGQAWIPDPLERVLPPYESRARPPEQSIPGQTATAFWLDAWIPAEARVGRMRLEAQLNVGEHWVIAPMEVRIRPVRIPDHADTSEALPPVEAPADRAALGPLLAFLCGTAEPPGAASVSVRRLIRRNARQDMALARQLAERLGEHAVREGLLRAAGAAGAASWCSGPETPAERGAEWYLRVRDYLLRAAE
jgi:hypothetical protein